MNITVYLGALRGNDPVLKDAVDYSQGTAPPIA